MALIKIPKEMGSTPGIVDNSNATAITIDSSENVGIGRTSITQPSSGATTLAIQGTDTTKGGAIRLYSSDDSVEAYIYPDNSSGLSINTSTSHPIVFRTVGNERMRIDATGNILLGTNGVIGGAGGSGAQIFVKQAANSNGISSVANSNNNYVRMLHTGTTGKIETTYGTGGSYTPLAFFTNGSEHTRLETAGNLNLLDGDLVVASGHGINFGATPHFGQKTSELLDDYEEGTWTPTISAIGGSSVTGIIVSEAYYTKVGRNVNISLYISSINLAQLTTGTYLVLGGLPFVCNGYSDFNFTYMRGGTTIRGGYAQSGQSFIYLCDGSGYESQQASNHLLTHLIGACAYMTNA